MTVNKEENIEKETVPYNASSDIHKKAIKKEFNSLATFTKVIAWLIFIGGLVVGIAEGTDKDSFNVTLAYWEKFFIAGFSWLLVAEVIQILHDIRLKVYKK